MLMWDHCLSVVLNPSSLYNTSVHSSPFFDYSIVPLTKQCEMSSDKVKLHQCLSNDIEAPAGDDRQSTRDDYCSFNLLLKRRC